MARRQSVDLDALGLPAAFTPAQAQAAGLSRAVRQRLLETGLLDRLDHGILVRPALADGADYQLLEAAVRAPRATLCLASALARHDLIDEIPSEVDLAIPRGSKTPVGPAVARWHRYDPATFDRGRTTAEVAPGIALGLYNAERSIVDAFNPRTALEHERAVEALRRWLGRRGSQPSLLLDMASPWPHARARLLPALQVLL